MPCQLPILNFSKSPQRPSRKHEHTPIANFLNFPIIPKISYPKNTLFREFPTLVILKQANAPFPAPLKTGKKGISNLGYSKTVSFPNFPALTCFWPWYSLHQPFSILTFWPSLLWSHCSFHKERVISSPASSFAAALHTFPLPLSFANSLTSPLLTTSKVISSTWVFGFNSLTFKKTPQANFSNQNLFKKNLLSQKKQILPQNTKEKE